MAYNLQNLLKTLRTPEVRELAWVIGSNPMFYSDAISLAKKSRTSIDLGVHQLELHSDWLIRLDKEPSRLVQHISSNKSFLLGKRFESFVQFWLMESEYFELLLFNKQLIKDKTTFGEIDFIFRDVECNEIVHLEVACKFYLAKENNKAWSNFVGPNGTDNLEEKMAKLKKQLNVFSGPLSPLALEQFSTSPPAPHPFIKGYLFHHFKNIAKAKAPTNASKTYNAAWYIRHSELDLLSGQFWCILEKSKWLSTVNASLDHLAVHSKNELAELLNEHFIRKRFAVCIVQLIDLGDGLVENSRGMVVPSNWQT